MQENPEPRVIVRTLDKCSVSVQLLLTSIPTKCRMEYTEEKKLECASCRKVIDFGRDIIAVEHGVNGPRGFVPLGETLLFCREKCVSDYFDSHDSNRQKLKPRIP